MLNEHGRCVSRPLLEPCRLTPGVPGAHVRRHLLPIFTSFDIELRTVKSSSGTGQTKGALLLLEFHSASRFPVRIVFLLDDSPRKSGRTKRKKHADETSAQTGQTIRSGTRTHSTTRALIIRDVLGERTREPCNHAAYRSHRLPPESVVVVPSPATPGARACQRCRVALSRPRRAFHQSRYLFVFPLSLSLSLASRPLADCLLLPRLKHQRRTLTRSA